MSKQKVDKARAMNITKMDQLHAQLREDFREIASLDPDAMNAVLGLFLLCEEVVTESVVPDAVGSVYARAARYVTGKLLHEALGRQEIT